MAAIKKFPANSLSELQMISGLPPLGGIGDGVAARTSEINNRVSFHNNCYEKAVLVTKVADWLVRIVGLFDSRPRTSMSPQDPS
jgi:hypothetical protein